MPEPFVGILSLDTAFDRIVGDAGNPASYPMPARLRVVEGACASRIVADAPPPEDVTARFVEAARALEAEGAGLIVSTCGFLVHVQAQVAAAVRVPVLLSGLSLVPLVRAATGRPVGVLTASAAALGPRSLGAAGIAAGSVHVAGMEGVAAFRETFLAAKEVQASRLDAVWMEAAVVARAEALVSAHPEVGALVLECGNLPPYAEAIRARTGRPVTHLLDGAALLWAGRFGAGG